MNMTRTSRSRFTAVLFLCVALAAIATSLASVVSLPSPGASPPKTNWKNFLGGGDGSSPWPVARIVPDLTKPPTAGWDAFHVGDWALVAWSETIGKDREISLVVTPVSGTPQRFQVTHNASPDTNPALTRSLSGQVGLVWLRTNRAGTALMGSLLDSTTGRPGPERLLMRLDSSVVEVSAALLPDQNYLFAKTIRQGAHISVEAGDPVSGFVPLIQVSAWPGFACWLATGATGESYLLWTQDENTIGLFIRGTNGQWSGPEYFPVE